MLAANQRQGTVRRDGGRDVGHSNPPRKVLSGERGWKQMGRGDSKVASGGGKF